MRRMTNKKESKRRCSRRRRETTFRYNVVFCCCCFFRPMFVTPFRFQKTSMYLQMRVLLTLVCVQSSDKVPLNKWINAKMLHTGKVLLFVCVAYIWCCCRPYTIHDAFVFLPRLRSCLSHIQIPTYSFSVKDKHLSYKHTQTKWKPKRRQ